MPQHKSLARRVALITGAAGTIGRAACQVLHEQGAFIVAADQASADFAPLAAFSPETCLAIKVDVADENSVVACIAGVRAKFGGRIDIFFNNAGIEGPVQKLHEYPLEAFRRVMAVNVEGVFLGLKHVLPVMMAQGAGSIINMSSVGGLAASPHVVGYIASKHAVVGLTRAAAVEAGPAGVRVNCICPGPIRSPMIDALNRQRGETEESRAARIPARRYGTSAEVASLVAYLASDAAAYINGAVLPVDGGIGACV